MGAKQQDSARACKGFLLWVSKESCWFFFPCHLGPKDLPSSTGKELEKLEMGREAQTLNFLPWHPPQTQ